MVLLLYSLNSDDLAKFDGNVIDKWAKQDGHQVEFEDLSRKREIRRLNTEISKLRCRIESGFYDQQKTEYEQQIKNLEAQK